MGDLKELHTAAEKGRLEDLKRLLSVGGVDLESADEDGETPLYKACAAGHADAVRILLDAGAQITGKSTGTFCDDWSYSPVLNCACSRGHTAVVKVLLDKGAPLNVSSDTGAGPLLAACGSEKAGVDMLRLLLEHGADPDEGDEDWRSPIMYVILSACEPGSYQGQLDKLKLLIDYGADVNKSENYYEGGNTPLHRAVDSSLTNIARILLEHGADVHALNKSRNTPLQVQYYLPPPEMIMLLLDYGGGSAPCHKKGCRCGLTVMQCCYNYSRYLNSGAAPFLFGINYQEHQNAFEMYFTKMKALGLIPLEDSEKGIVETYDFWNACKAELAKMKTEKVSNTTVTYKNIWNQRPAALRQVDSLPVEDVFKLPIYGIQIRRRFIIGRRKLLLMDKAQSFFSLLSSPKLLSECIEIILDFLSEDDLKNLADIVASTIRKNKKTKSPGDLDKPTQATKIPKTDKD